MNPRTGREGGGSRGRGGRQEFFTVGLGAQTIPCMPVAVMSDSNGKSYTGVVRVGRGYRVGYGRYSRCVFNCLSNINTIKNHTPPSPSTLFNKGELAQPNNPLHY